MLCSWILVPSRTSMGKFPFLECIFEGNQIFFILNGYRKRAVCRKHKVESGNWSFDPSGALLQPSLFLISLPPFLSQLSLLASI